MFWKKKPVVDKSAEVEAAMKQPKAKKLTPKDILAEQIEKLEEGQVLRFLFPVAWGGDLGVIELNPNFPTKGKKYTLSTEKLADGKPAGQRSLICDADKPKELASWVLDRKGEPFVMPEEAPASSKEAPVSPAVTKLPSEA